MRLYQFFTLFALAGCGSGYTQITDTAQTPTPVDAPSVSAEVNTSGGGEEQEQVQVQQFLSAPQVVQPSVVTCSDSRVLYLNPDPNIIPFVQTAIAKFSLMGFNVAISGTPGVRMYEVASISNGAQAWSSWKGAAPCVYDGCTNANSHINVTTALLQRTDTAFIDHSIQHEIGHLLSGFGSCVTPEMNLIMADTLHLVAGHMISNGNTGYANMTWTEQDTILLHSCL